MDFTIKQYTLLLNALVAQGYTFQSFAHYVKDKENPALALSLQVERSRDVVEAPRTSIILRHDVEARYENALRMAQIQNKLGIQATYYFRILPECFKPDIVKKIAELGHEIGYHYDDLAVCKGDFEKAIARFQKNLKTLRDIAPVETICMDGSPLSRFDNKDLWRKRDASASLSMTDASATLSMTETDENSSLTTHRSSLSTQYSYKDFGIIGEPYFDLDFKEVFYLTDTGRMWDGDRFNVRDKPYRAVSGEKRIESKLERSLSPETSGEKGVGSPSATLRVKETQSAMRHAPCANRFHSTKDIIRAIEKGTFPQQAMITFHPQRWSDAFLPWAKELVLQNVKNQVKRLLVKG